MHGNTFRLVTTTGSDRRSRRSVALRLLQERKIFLGREVTPRLAHTIMAQLMFMEAEAPDAPIQLYINSPGGDVSSGLAIFDTIRLLKSPVTTIATGLAASMGTIILEAAAKGLRQSYPNARILIHQPLGGVRGQATDVEIHAREILKIKDRLNRILAESTGPPVKKIEEDTNRDFWMTAEEAMAYGLVDQILQPRETAPGAVL
ncbi:MAG: ATP-dependent Clp protease proteolytic subunit [Candidatus Riflebacteria bacterium]|nr:ATP-dependent Clp protease proteolytic subunit [Candidatus Riflebacteria bacterium]